MIHIMHINYINTKHHSIIIINMLIIFNMFHKYIYFIIFAFFILNISFFINLIKFMIVIIIIINIDFMYLKSYNTNMLFVLHNIIGLLIININLIKNMFFMNII